MEYFSVNPCGKQDDQCGAESHHDGVFRAVGDGVCRKEHIQQDDEVGVGKIEGQCVTADIGEEGLFPRHRGNDEGRTDHRDDHRTVVSPQPVPNIAQVCAEFLNF